MIPFKEVNVLDINAEYLGVSTSQLMENAGKATAKVARERFGISGRNVVIICGPGNNGGDGFVAARHLLGECQVELILVRPKDKIRSDIAKANFCKIEDKLKILDASDLDMKLQGAHLIIDAMLGIGIAGELREPYLSCTEAVNRADVPVLSVDVPSGLGTKNPVIPEMTVTFHDVKEGMDEKNSGEITVVDIGIPKEAEQYLGPGEFVYYPRPGKDSHKGDNGRLLIIGGGPYSGAPALAALAAYRIGVDLVHIATPAKTYAIIASYSPDFIVHRLGGDVLTKDDTKTIRSLMEKIDAVIIGPGLGEAKDTAEAVREVIAHCQKPLVIDADAVKPVAEEMGTLEGKKGVLTPHAHEFMTLFREAVKTDLNERSEQVRAFSERTNLTVLLKGNIDIVSDGVHVKLNLTGNPAMTVGGTGDVLAGIVGGMLAKGASPFSSARIAAFTCGLAGELAFEGLGYSMMASDVIERIPPVLKSFLR